MIIKFVEARIIFKETIIKVRIKNIKMEQKMVRVEKLITMLALLFLFIDIIRANKFQLQASYISKGNAIKAILIVCPYICAFEKHFLPQT